MHDDNVGVADVTHAPHVGAAHFNHTAPPAGDGVHPDEVPLNALVDFKDFGLQGNEAQQRLLRYVVPGRRQLHAAHILEVRVHEKRLQQQLAQPHAQVKQYLPTGGLEVVHV